MASLIYTFVSLTCLRTCLGLRMELVFAKTNDSNKSVWYKDLASDAAAVLEVASRLASEARAEENKANEPSQHLSLQSTLLHGKAAYVAIVGSILLATVAILWKIRQFIQGCWFDARCPTHCAQKDLRGRNVIVTGASVGGIGCAAAEMLAERGAKVIITCRTQEKATAAAERVTLAAATAGIVDGDAVGTLLVDFESRASVRAAAAKFIKEFGQLDLLVLNAGIADGKSDVVWQTNHVGPFMFTEELRPLLEHAAARHGDARVVAVSSGVHRRAVISDKPYDAKPGEAYSQSKLAQIMHIREMQRRARAAAGGKTGFRCIAVTPGFAYTKLFCHSCTDRPLWRRLAMTCGLSLFARSPRTSAEVVLMACLDEYLEGGEYLSNCTVKKTEGKDNCAESESAWARCWTITECCAADGRFETKSD